MYAKREQGVLLGEERDQQEGKGGMGIEGGERENKNKA